MVNQGINMKVDMQDINHVIGMGFALDELGRQSRYVQNLIHSAFLNTEDNINREIAAFAGVSKAMGHMFEWGTLGINTGRSNMRPGQFSDKARLWEDVFIPGRTKSTLTFVYKPSVATVPKPTSQKTGIPADVLKRLKVHVFWNKARVLEEGWAVTIKPKPENKRQLLFVPNLWKGEKGYTMYNRPTRPDVSKETKGTFTIYWFNAWETRGQEMMQTLVNAYFMEDYRKVLAKLQAGKGGSLHAPNSAVDKAQIKRSARTVRKYLEAAAQQRVAKGKVKSGQ